MSNSLFLSFQSGSLSLANRVVMAPMTRSRATGNVPNSLMAEYYSQRASAGLIVTEGVAPSPNGLGYARIPGAFLDEQIEAWKEVASAVHERGSKIFMQLMHTGRVSHADNMPAGSVIVAPSALAAKGQMWTDEGGMKDLPTPQEMSAEQITQAREEFVRAAEGAIAAGFDGVEVHSANGYLLEQFLNPTVNRRTDDYGGSPEKNARIVVEVLDRIAASIGPERLGIRLSPHNTFNDMGVYDDVLSHYKPIAEAAARLGIAYVHCIRGAHVPQDTLTQIRESFGGTFILNAGYDGIQAQADLDEGRADLIAFGSKFISNPDLVHRMKNGLDLAPADPSSFYTPDAKGYTDYPGT